MAHPPLDERALDAAVAAGVVDAETRERLVDFAAAWRDGRGAAVAAAATADANVIVVADEEQFRLLTGFNDIFVAIAIAILLFAVGRLAGQVSSEPSVIEAVSSLALAATAWLLSEYFVRRRRMALPAVELLIVFVIAVSGAAIGLLGIVMGADSISFQATMETVPASGKAASQINMKTGAIPPTMVFAGLIAGVAAAWAHWRRFRVPITLAAGCAVIILPVMALLGSQLGGTAALIAGFLGGIAVFLLAMRIDASDRARLTRRTDMAFWLHLLAAPLIVHPVLSQLQSPANPSLALVAAAGTILIYLVLAFIALAVDRRALLVSGLAYVIYALGVVVQSGADPSTGFTVTALIVGGSLVLLAAAWARARRSVVGVLPADVQALVPPAV